MTTTIQHNMAYTQHIEHTQSPNNKTHITNTILYKYPKGIFNRKLSISAYAHTYNMFLFHNFTIFHIDIYELEHARGFHLHNMKKGKLQSAPHFTNNYCKDFMTKNLVLSRYAFSLIYTYGKHNKL